MKKNIFILSFFIFTNVIFGQDILSFNDCLGIALKDNLQIKSALNDEKIAVNQNIASYGKILPSIFIETESRNSSGREIDQNTNQFVNQELNYYKSTANAMFNLFSGFTVINTIRSTKQEINIRKVNIKRIENEITMDLAQKFITILYLEEIILANKEQINSSEKQLELALLKFESGVIAESEVFKIKTQKAREELTLLTSENRLTDNLVGLKQLMNLPLEKEIKLLKPKTELSKNLIIEENQFTLAKKAVEMNPLYAMSLLKEKKARTNLSLARAPLFPVLTLRMLAGSNYTDNYIDKDIGLITNDDQIDNNFTKGFRFNLIIPIFSQMDNFSKIKTSKLNIKQSKFDTQIVKNNLSKEVLKVINDTKTSIKKNQASTVAYEFSQKSYEAELLKFELGKINISELNLTKMFFNNSQADLIQSKYELMFNNALINFYLGEDFSL